MKGNDFDQELKYNLYRSVKEILHPTISKRNISDYKIILSEELMPLRIAYPKKVSNIENVMIYIHGAGEITECVGSYYDISSTIALNYNQLVISLDYEVYSDLELLKLYDKFYETFKFIYFELLASGISKKQITLIGDSTGASAILSIINKCQKENITISKQILFYPILSGKYFTKDIFAKEENLGNKKLIKRIVSYYTERIGDKNNLKDENIFALNKKSFTNYPQTLIICGNGDILLDDAKNLNELLGEQASLVEVPFAFHGFLKNTDKDLTKDFTSKIKEFLSK